MKTPKIIKNFNIWVETHWNAIRLILLGFIFGVVIQTIRFANYYSNLENTITKSEITDDMKYYYTYWIDVAKLMPTWTPRKEHRLRSLKSIYMIPHHQMPSIKLKDGRLASPLAYTSFDIDSNGVVIPTKIVLSDKLTFDTVGANFIIWHELGHAIGLLDDEYENFTHQIMWYGNMKTYANFYNTAFALNKLGHQLHKPENTVMESEMISSKKKTIYFFGTSNCELH